MPIGTILLAHRVLGLGLLISNHSRERPIVYVSRSLALAALALCGWIGESIPALSADLGPRPQTPLVAPVAPPSQWQFSFTPYGWMTSVNGNATARGHTVDIDANFFDIVEKSDSLMALMGYFEARKGRLGLFTDVVWEDLTFDVHRSTDINRSVSGNPFARLPDFNVTIKGNLNIKANAQLDYQSTIVQSGVAYEVAKWGAGPASYTALDVLGGARYWNQELDISLGVAGTLNADVQADFKRLGLSVRRSVRRSAATAIARSGDLEWVDPFVGGRIRHQIAADKELMLEGDVGGFGAGSDFSWQVVGTYGFDVNCFRTPFHTVIGYRALAVDFSEKGRFGKNGVDDVQHGPVMGVSFRW